MFSSARQFEFGGGSTGFEPVDCMYPESVTTPQDVVSRFRFSLQSESCGPVPYRWANSPVGGREVDQHSLAGKACLPDSNRLHPGLKPDALPNELKRMYADAVPDRAQKYLHHGVSASSISIMEYR